MARKEQHDDPRSDRFVFSRYRLPKSSGQRAMSLCSLSRRSSRRSSSQPSATEKAPRSRLFLLWMPVRSVRSRCKTLPYIWVTCCGCCVAVLRQTASRPLPDDSLALVSIAPELPKIVRSISDGALQDSEWQQPQPEKPEIHNPKPKARSHGYQTPNPGIVSELCLNLR